MAVALSNGYGAIVILMIEFIISHVSDPAKAASAIQVVLEVSRNAWPDLDSCAVASVTHGDVVNVKILDNVGDVLVLAKGPYTDAVGAVADEVLDDDVGAVGLERDTI